MGENGKIQQSKTRLIGAVCPKCRRDWGEVLRRSVVFCPCCRRWFMPSRVITPSDPNDEDFKQMRFLPEE